MYRHSGDAMDTALKNHSVAASQDLPHLSKRDFVPSNRRRLSAPACVLLGVADLWGLTSRRASDLGTARSLSQMPTGPPVSMPSFTG
jgi:hypothetical protein